MLHQGLKILAEGSLKNLPLIRHWSWPRTACPYSQRRHETKVSESSPYKEFFSGRLFIKRAQNFKLSSSNRTIYLFRIKDILWCRSNRRFWYL